jgi:hypothetical protein
LGACRAGLSQLRRNLRLGRLELRLGPLECRLAGVALLEELLLAVELLGRHFERGARGLDQRVAGGHVLLRRPSVDPCQHLTGFDNIANLHLDGDHCARHLRGHDGLPDGFDDTIKAGGLAGTRRLHDGGRQLARGCRADGRAEQTRDYRRTQQAFLQHPTSPRRPIYAGNSHRVAIRHL